ncbi:RdgB/HAM1 family non-canonical purine NTP pyrophosphatase [Borrelia sp. BU AG58]|uniref:RdgB/HAM1 family non-canonical purine NTP pyrophosphatase n=1 Tax=Borrelia sp. BU AG58 TaxID=2887345 RepID=UPI001E56FB18|nr:RdgB/HAM1 family non-canonical purine NTP pyrophosphatase [Borrelia sp. BU AG58]UER67438.1 RdgB/HAM1 family non-canonical purine NTP pyrophosphatase [Borrelia sp. BU AG58]
MRTLFFATANINKVKEVKKILNIHNIKIEVPKNFDIQETGTTFKENSLIKAKALFEALGKKYHVFSEDSGLCIEALDLEPGIYSKRYGKYKLGKKLNAHEKNQLIIDLMKHKTDRKAYFVCMVSHISTDGQISTFEGVFTGSIASDINCYQKNGFGYDPIFLTNNNKRLSELSLAEKNKISHRGIAFTKFKNFIIERFA